ncbi:hypothetical protein AMJ49_03410 [Parcubacteria bacterium DG_74_2]|nr:MAG: hypothetical protein AMJ49_03410 [Parcubacteria bacterium DG_74_2]
MQNFLKIKKILFFFIFLTFLFSSFSFAQESPTSTQPSKLSNPQGNLSPIQETEKEKKTLQNEIYILRTKIAKLDLQIQENQLMVKDLGFQIKETETSIDKTSLRIENKREQITNILRTIYEEDQKSFFEILLSERTLSDFFDSLNQLQILHSENQELLKEIKDLKSFLESEKTFLDEEKIDVERLLSIQSLQKKESENIKGDKDWLLEETKGQESEYQKLLAEKEKKAAEIRSRIFELIGVARAPTFGEAYEISKFVYEITGVRPAFLLAVLEQESRIGQNVGQCFLRDTKTGGGVRAKTGEEISRVMSPTRDVKPFLSITEELGRDPFNTLVSCPMSFGWGGAMGPAQFIPSTWVRYRKRVSEIIKKAADPWEIKDSFLAAALYLADYGADKRIPEAEWKAAMIYFAGRIDSRFRWYADQVLVKATEFEKDIRELEGG